MCWSLVFVPAAAVAAAAEFAGTAASCPMTKLSKLSAAASLAGSYVVYVLSPTGSAATADLGVVDKHPGVAVLA